MGHVHDGTHRHDAAPDMGGAFAVGIGLNLTFVAVEAVFGVLADSTALLADAAHNLSDVLGLAVAWSVSALAKRKATARHTYGLRGSTILGALANAVLLLVVVGGLMWEALTRLSEPDSAHGGTMMAVAAAGVVVNGASALMFLRAGKRDANVRGAFLHLAADAAVSLGVVIAGAVIATTSWFWVDPATSLLISVIVLIGTWGLLREALHLALAGVPSHVDPAAVRSYLERLPGVCGVHDLHIWAMSTTEVAMTVHLVMAWHAEPPTFLPRLDHELHAHFGIDHTTVQIEPLGVHADCRQAADDAV
jgi:cobalt-zinc-cadmium efflux system protein